MEELNPEIMTMQRWNELSDADRSLLIMIGIQPVQPKEKKVKHTNPITLERRLSTRNTCPAEYYVRIFDTCGCCKTKSEIWGKMERRKPSDNFLSLKVMCEIPVEEVRGVRTLKITSVNCIKCDEVLEGLGTEALIKMVKLMHEGNARRCMP